MEIKALLQEKIKVAMKSGNKQELTILRIASAKIKQVEIDKRKELDTISQISIISKLLKQLNESIVIYAKSGRTDLVEKEKLEAKVIESLLPKALTEDELKSLIDKTILEFGANSIKDMARIINIIKTKCPANDMKLISQLIKSKLN